MRMGPKVCRDVIIESERTYIRAWYEGNIEAVKYVGI